MTGMIELKNPADFPLAGTRLIEASAGTGKTWTIAALYVRLILRHDPHGVLPHPNLMPPDILVVTYTEAATLELRERIRQRLAEAARYFRKQNDCTDPFLQSIRADFREDGWPACAMRLELAANWMDEAAIFTIHGWCHRMLEQHAFASGNLFRHEIEMVDDELFLQTVRDYWRFFFYPLSSMLCQGIVQFAASPEALAGELSPLLSLINVDDLAFNGDFPALLNAWETWATQREALEATARKSWLRDCTAINALLTTASSEGWLNGTKYPRARFAERLDEMMVWATQNSFVAADSVMKFGRKKLLSALVKAHQDKMESFSLEAFGAIDAWIDHLTAEPDLRTQIIRHALQWVGSRYDAEKRHRARITFDDMPRRLDQALREPGGKRLAANLRRQYPIALIDEFQDTDVLQFNIFSALYADCPDSDFGCFLIGDPKQAIYSFRGADIFAYLKAKQQTTGRHYTLGTNFRSTTAFVDAVNTIFLQADQQPQGAFRFRQDDDNPLPFYPVTAQGRDETWHNGCVNPPALTFWLWPGSDAIGFPAYREGFAEAAASEIVLLLRHSQSGDVGFKTENGAIIPLQPKDIAILVRTGTEAKVMRLALAKRNLRSVYLSERDSVFATPEAQDMLLWLRAFAEPGNERKVRAALATATFGWGREALANLAAAESGWEDHLERFLRYRDRWQQDGILPALRHLLDDYTLSARLLSQPDGERRLTNILHLAELLQQDAGQLEGEYALIRHLSESIALGSSGQNDETVVRLESDADLIKIVTIHKAKGLEYPLVFLPFICSFRESGGRSATFYRYHDIDSNLRVDLTRSDTARMLSEGERLQEDVRLLYVALTRARFACWLGIAPVKSGSGKSCALEKSAVGALLGWTPDTPSEVLAAKLNALQKNCDSIAVADMPETDNTSYLPATSVEQCEAVRSVRTAATQDWWIASYSALHRHNKDVTEDSLENETAGNDKRQDEDAFETEIPEQLPTGIHALPRGAEPGVAYHALLEQCARSGFRKIAGQPAQATGLIRTLFPTRAWAGHHDVLASALPAWLTLPLFEGTDLCLESLPDGSYRPEMAFLLGIDAAATPTLDRLLQRHILPGKSRPPLQPCRLNGLLKGFIDLVFEHEGRYYIADYKFNFLGPDNASYTLDALEKALLAERYDLQAALYLLALHRLLKSRLGGDYSFDRHFGGGLYLFLRGVHAPSGGRLFVKPDRNLLENADRLFSGGHMA